MPVDRWQIFGFPEALCDGKAPEDVCDKLLALLQSICRKTFAVTEVRVASERFHSRLNVVKKDLCIPDLERGISKRI